MAYLLDANVFIQAKNLHYGLDFCPAFWDWLIEGNAAENVFSTEKVGDEIQAIADELSEWASDRGEDFFLKPDTRLLASLSAVSGWATSQSCNVVALCDHVRFLGDGQLKHEILRKIARGFASQSDDRNLARPFKAGTVERPLVRRRMATVDSFSRRYATKVIIVGADPGVETPG